MAQEWGNPKGKIIKNSMAPYLLCKYWNGGIFTKSYKELFVFDSFKPCLTTHFVVKLQLFELISSHYIIL